MATRTIVTSQPDVACDVCERRLLRGEQSEVFLADGRRRTVCELCAPRAAYEGWVRESDSQSLMLPPARPRRGRGFFERLRTAARPAAETAAPGSAPEPDPAPPAAPYDFLGERPRATAEPVPAAPRASGERQGGDAGDQYDAGASYLEEALAFFNASEYPRRVAGVARSLGAPGVSVRSAEHLASVVVIVVAWELCWYRYEVDLSEDVVETRVVAQGTELHELERDERAVNAVATESGALALTGGRQLAGT